jgi:hypothetical protein
VGLGPWVFVGFGLALGVTAVVGRLLSVAEGRGVIIVGLGAGISGGLMQAERATTSSKLMEKIRTK